MQRYLAASYLDSWEGMNREKEAGIYRRSGDVGVQEVIYLTVLVVQGLRLEFYQRDTCPTSKEHRSIVEQDQVFYSSRGAPRWTGCKAAIRT